MAEHKLEGLRECFNLRSRSFGGSASTTPSAKNTCTICH